MAEPPPDPAPPRPLLSILIPVYNERRTLRTIVRRVLDAGIPVPFELIAVDDGSTDGSFEVLGSLAEGDGRIRVLRHDRNKGKGAAIRTALPHLRGEIVVTQDADLEYDPADIARLVRPILDGRADAVFGSRFLSGEYRRVLYFWHSLGNGLLTGLCNVLCDLNLTDMETGYKAVRADLLRQTPLKSRKFGFEPELAVRLAQWGVRLYEVPISYAGRTYLEGKKVRWADGLRAIGVMLRCRFLDRRFTSHDGYAVLVAMRKARGLNRWLFRQIAPWVGDRVLEAGCGIGNLTELLLERDRLVATDNEPFYVEMISRRFGHLENVSTVEMDLARAADYGRIGPERLDTIVCLNVLEHIAADEEVLRLFCRALVPGGHAIILVPQHPWLYSPTDRALGHERRYEESELRRKLEEAGFEVVHQQGFNRFGTLGWYVSGKIFGRDRLSPGQMRLFDLLLPLARLVEHVPGWPALSTIAVGRKPTG
ncbi:bifunctional glycosyltransferase/class I SAM-dependent methyltransferase [Tautonia plasticadhaerens]|uniref:Undecaprenyl-phosphate mannosyltransferase n=1 Tax=Tautonia plasticadhaerens TaxID=2527974 RepID=A0A518H030_9BACT|nr:bifunctional glycosyltransferase/class I SAM-dependent methyltransferase [Tautonia plasticadhaerens]QDV34198.1 Undecaprenyl-phosphate mannosyltransferase [Tautonia plasticadhaerens]